MDKRGLDSLYNYLYNLSINTSDKNYVMNFYQKLNAIEQINNSIINNTKIEKPSLSFGNYNADFLFIFDNENYYNAIQKCLSNLFKYFNAKAWDIYITFINKVSDIDINLLVNCVISEIDIVKPKYLYMFECDNKFIEFVKNKYSSFINVIAVNNLQDIIINNKKLLFDIFKYLIN